MKSGRLTSLINEEQLKELEPRSSHWVSDLLSLSSHRQESLVPRCNSSTNAVAGKSLLEMTLSTTASAAYSQHNGLCEDNQRMARLLGADLNESSMSWTSSLATPIVSSFVVTPLPNSTSGSLKKDPTNGSGFLLPSLTPRAPLSNKQDGRTMQRSSGRRIQVCPRTLFSASSLLENSNTSLSVDAGNKLVSDAELIAVSFEDEPSEGVKKDSQGIVNCQNLHQGQPITTSNAKVNESSVIGNLSDDALSVFFQSPEVGTRRKLRRVPKQRAKRKYVTNLTSGLELSPNVGHSLVSESEHCDVSSNTNTLISHQKICAKTSGDTTEPQTSAITGMILENSETVVEDAIRIESTNASTASSICNKMAVKTTNSVLESGSQMLDFSPAEVTTRIVSTVRPIFSRNHSKLQSPINIQSRCVNQSFSDLASSPFIVLPECASTPIRVLTKVKEHQDKNLSSGDADRLHPRRDSGTGQMNRASDSVGSNHGVGFSGVSVDAALGTSSSSKRCSEANSQDVLQSLKKPRKFVYPTAAQIARTCPKKVFSFQSKPVVACENSQNRVLENKKPDVSFHSLKHCVLPAAYDSPSVFPSAKESTCRLITSDAHLNPISEGEQKSSCMGKTSSDDNTLLKLDAESAKTSIISTQSSLPSKSCFSDPKPATAGTNQVPLAVNSSKNLIPIADTIYTKHENRKEDLALSVHATASTYIDTASVETVGSESRHELCFQELVGFRMASGKQVTVSETALVKAENLLNDVIFDTGLSTFNTQPSQKAGGSYLEGADLVEKRSTEDGNSSRAKPCHSTNFVEPYTNATESLLNSADGYDMSDGSCRNDKVVCMSNVAHRKSNTVSVDFKSAGGKSLSVSSAAEAKAKKIIETALEELIDDGSLLDDASLATRGFATGIGVEFKSTGKNKISSSHTNFPDSSSLAAGNACNLTTFDTSRSAFQHADGIRDRHCNRLKQENLPKGFRPFKTPRVFIKKNNEHGQYQGELKGGKLLEVHDEKEISNEVSSDPNLIHKFSSEICSSSLTNTQLAEVADVSWLLQHQVDLLSTQTFNSATLHRHGYEEASEGSMRILSDGAQKKDVGTICEISGASGARTSEKDSICDDNMDIDCAMAWDVVNDDGDQSKNKPGILDCEVLSVVPDCGTEEVKQLMYHVANTAFDNSMEFVSASDQHDVESKVKFQVGFQTAKGNPVKISSAALEKAKCFLSDTSCDVIPTESESNFPMGFQTAKGNPIKISSAALEKAKCILADTSCDVIPTEVKSDFPIGFQTAKGNPVKISSAALEKAKCVLDDTSCDFLFTEAKVNFPIGFQTAKGNPVKISSAALEEAKCVLSDTSFENKTNSSVKIGFAALEKAESFMFESSCDVIPSESKSTFPIGFQTAKGNMVKISSAALEKAKNVLNDTCDVISSDLDFPTSFQTANEHPVKVNSAAFDESETFLNDALYDVIANESVPTFPFDLGTPKGIPVCASSEALDNTQNLFSMSEGDEKSFCDHVNQKTEDLAIVSDCLKNSKEEGASLDPVRRSEMPASVFYDVNDWTGSTDEDLLAAEVGPSAFDSTDLLSPGLAVRPSFGKDDKCGEKEQLRELPSHTHAGILKNCDRQYGRQQFSSFTTIPESFKNDRQGAMKYIDEVPVRDKKPGGASSQHFRLLTALWTYPESEVTSSSTIVINKAGYPVSADVNSNVATGQSVDADSKQTAKFFTPYKKLPPQNLDKAVAVLDVSTPVDVRRNIKPGPQFSVASKYDLTLSKGEGCSNVTNTTETLSAGDEISCIGTEGERTNEKCSDSSRAAAAAVADDGGALHSNMSGHQQTLVSVCEKVRELRRLAREKQLARVASKNQNQNVRPYPGQLWMARKKGSGVTRIPMGSAVSGKKPASYSRQQLYSCGVLNQTMSITARNAEEFYFDISETFSTETAMSSVGCHGADGAYLVFTENGRLGKEEFCNALMDMPGVAPYLISRSWVYNHFRWIVWKLAAMEVAFPEEFAGRCLTPNNVMMQLKYRYDREVDHSQRSAVKKIFEKDDTSRKTLVLCVSSIFSSNSLELTDGWYSIKAMLDGPLSCLVAGNKIRVGDKICVFGSDLVGLDDATTPLEAPDDVALKICANSTRLAKWDTRLGFLHVCRPPKFPIVSVYPDGGMVGCLDVVLTRIYPIQYLEKLPDGSSVMRTSSSEQRAAQEHEKRREKCIEKLSNRLEQKFEKEWDNAGATPKTRSASRLKPSEIHSAVEIYESYRHASDPGAFESCLTTEQLGILRKHIDQEEQRRQTELQECLQSIMSEADDLVPKRNVTPLLKIQIAGCSWQDLDAKCQAFFTIWRPSEEVVEMLKEGSRFLIFNVSAGVNRVRNCQCKVSFTSVKSTKYEKFPSVDKNFLDLLYEPRRAVNFEELRRRNFIAKYGEVDVAGIVIHVTLPSSDQQNNNKGGNQHTVYLVDDCEAFLAVKFWGGMPLHDVQDSLTVGQVVSFTSLRSQSCCGSVPCAYYSDLSAFSVKYHQKHMRVATDNLASWVKSSDFLSVMTERLTDLITRKSGADDQLKEDLKMPLIPSIAKDSSIKRKVHFSGLRQVNSRPKQSSNQKPVVASTNSDNFEESAQGSNLPPSECVSSEGDCDKLPLHCNAQACSVPTNEKPTSNVSGIETIDWCDDSAEEALLQASSSGIVDVNSENLLSADDTRSFKRTRKRMRIETETMPQRKSSRLK